MGEPALSVDLCSACGRDLEAHLADRGTRCPELHGIRLDLRRRHFMWGGSVCVEARYTDACSGCFEAGDHMGLAHHYGYDAKAGCYVGTGCDECGYTGKRVRLAPVPAFVFYDGGDRA